MKRYFALIIILLMTSIILGQDVGRSSTQKSARTVDKRSAARYIFSPGTDAYLMTVKVWGEVRQPGIYEVPIGVDLVELLSSAGGPTNKAKLSKIKIIHAEEEDGEDLVVSVNVKEFLNTGNSELIPEIKPNDTIVVPVKPTQYILTSLSYTSQIMSLLYVFAMMDYYRTRP